LFYSEMTSNIGDADCQKGFYGKIAILQCFAIFEKSFFFQAFSKFCNVLL
jgi:hypothetical protein